MAKAAPKHAGHRPLTRSMAKTPPATNPLSSASPGGKRPAVVVGSTSEDVEEDEEEAEETKSSGDAEASPADDGPSASHGPQTPPTERRPRQDVVESVDSSKVPRILFPPQPNRKRILAADETIFVQGSEPEGKPQKRRRTVGKVPLLAHRLKSKEESTPRSTSSSNGLDIVVLRRSARIRQGKMVVAMSFEKFFSLLPLELQLFIWDLAAADESNARVVPVRNLAVAGSHQRLPNELPALFTTCVDSYRAMASRYKRLFCIDPTRYMDQEAIEVSQLRDTMIPSRGSGRRIMRLENRPTTRSVHKEQEEMPSEEVEFVTGHWMDVSKDVALLEPCCSGCRAYHCACSHFSLEERKSVRFLAVQMESERLSPTTWPCWRTVELGWPNVELLILVKNLPGIPFSNLGGQRRTLRRCTEQPHEKRLRENFDLWKGTPAGKVSNIRTLEFARMDVVPCAVSGLLLAPPLLKQDEKETWSLPAEKGQSLPPYETSQ